MHLHPPVRLAREHEENEVILMTLIIIYYSFSLVFSSPSPLPTPFINHHQPASFFFTLHLLFLLLLLLLLLLVPALATSSSDINPACLVLCVFSTFPDTRSSPVVIGWSGQSRPPQESFNPSPPPRPLTHHTSRRRTVTEFSTSAIILARPLYLSIPIHHPAILDRRLPPSPIVDSIAPPS
jgi:hypothetical protein